MDYDLYGNMTDYEYTNSGSLLGTPDYIVNIGYYSDPNTNILGVASSHTVSGGNGSR